MKRRDILLGASCAIASTLSLAAPSVERKVASDLITVSEFLNLRWGEVAGGAILVDGGGIQTAAVLSPSGKSNFQWRMAVSTRAGIEQYSSPTGVVWSKGGLPSLPEGASPAWMRNGERVSLLFESHQRVLSTSLDSNNGWMTPQTVFELPHMSGASVPLTVSAADPSHVYFNRGVALSRNPETGYMVSQSTLDGVFCVVACRDGLVAVSAGSSSGLKLLASVDGLAWQDTGKESGIPDAGAKSLSIQYDRTIGAYWLFRNTAKGVTGWIALDRRRNV